MNYRNSSVFYKEKYRESTRLWSRLVKKLLELFEDREVKVLERPRAEFKPPPYKPRKTILLYKPELGMKTSLKISAKTHIQRPEATPIETIAIPEQVEIHRESLTRRAIVPSISKVELAKPALIAVKPIRRLEVRVLADELLEAEDLALIKEIGGDRIQSSLLELAFRLKPLTGSGDSNPISWEGTTLIVFECSSEQAGLEYSLALVALEHYRSLASSPKHLDPVIIAGEEDLALLQARDEGVFVFTCDYAKSIGDDKHRLGYLREHLNKLTGYGFKTVIMPSELIARLEKLEKRDAPYTSRLYRIPARVLVPTDYDPEKLCLTSVFITGFLEDPRKCSVSPRRGDLLVLSRTTMARLLDEPLNMVINLMPWKLRASVSEAESYSHLALKAIAILHLVKNKGISPSNVLVEDEVDKDACSGLIPDVYVSGSKDIVVEVKSGLGKLPLIDVREAFEKYATNCYHAKEIWVVVRPFTFALHTKPLLRLLKELRERYKNKTLRLMIPAYVDGKYMLLDSRDFLKSIRTLVKSLRSS